MNTPKISYPQELPAVLEEAKNEENWLIFAVGKANEKGKRPKQPVRGERPDILGGADKGAQITYARAMKRLKRFGREDLHEINRKRAEYAREKGQKAPWLIEGYMLGYLPREDSALVALDFDDCVEVSGRRRKITDKKLRNLVNKSSAYIEVSTSGTGLRVFMPRAWGDDSWGYTGERGGVGCFADNRFGCVLTGNVLRDGVSRDEQLFDLVKKRHGAAGARERAKNHSSIEEEIVTHGRREVDVFRDIVKAVKNDDRFSEWGVWAGMIWAAKEYYTIADPERLDEVKDVVRAWSEGWTGGEHDPEVFDEVWERDTNPGKIGATGLGSWVEYALGAGFRFPSPEIVVEEAVEDEWGFLKRLDTEQAGPSGKKITRAIANYMNAVKTVRHMPALKGLIGRNVLTGGLVRLREWDGSPRDYPAEWTDVDMHRAIQTIQGAKKNGAAMFSHWHLDQIKQGIEGGAALVQPVRGMIQGLPDWDGRERIDLWLTDYFGVRDRPVARAYARKFMIGLIARGMAMPEKPVKVDTVLVLTGRQGMNKSTFFETLAGPGDLFADHVGDISKKDGAENIAGRWICEFAEGEIMTKADRKALKGFLARTVDKYRPAYGRNVQSFPRACVFVMPTNEEEVLNDPTGSRRYWPVTATKTASLGRLRVERRQLLAEARAAYEAGETWWLTDEEEALREAEAAEYEIEDAFEEPLAALLENVIEGQVVSQGEILGYLGVESAKGGNSWAERRVRDILKKWGWERYRVGKKRGYRRVTLGVTVKASLPPISEEAEKARKEGKVLPLPVSSEFSRAE